MQRSLNPQLFGSQHGQGDSVMSVTDPRLPASHVMGAGEDFGRKTAYPTVEIRSLQETVMNLKGALSQMERRSETIAFKMEELARTVHARLERFSQSIARFEESQNKTQGENAQRFATIVAKVNERKVGDMKVQELMDRHNAVIRNFENRMLSLQRLTSEQEMTLHNAQAALIEARNEIARLKR